MRPREKHRDMRFRMVLHHSGHLHSQLVIRCKPRQRIYGVSFPSEKLLKAKLVESLMLRLGSLAAFLTQFVEQRKVTENNNS